MTEKEISRVEAASPLELEEIKLEQRRGPGRGIGQKRLTNQMLTRLDTLFQNLIQLRGFLLQDGHLIINESGSILAPQSHKNLDHLISLLEDFLWILNCSISKLGGTPQLF
ncbi:MAG: hypothetical protein ACFFDP_12725 [Promethearchaeota archaeon]